MRMDRLDAKLSLITVGMLVASLTAYASVYASIFLNVTPEHRAEVVFLATISFCLALAKFIVIDWD